MDNMRHDQGHSTLDVARLVGTSYRVIDYWSRTGVLRPEHAEARGQGTRRLYSDDDLRVTGVLNVLRQMGASTDVLARAAPAIRSSTALVLFVSPLGDVLDTVVAAADAWSCWWTVVRRGAQPSTPADRVRLEVAAA